jgi:transcriptional regulator
MPLITEQHHVKVVFSYTEIIELLEEKASHLTTTKGLVKKEAYLEADGAVAITYEKEASA